MQCLLLNFTTVLWGFFFKWIDTSRSWRSGDNILKVYMLLGGVGICDTNVAILSYSVLWIYPETNPAFFFIWDLLPNKMLIFPWLCCFASFSIELEVCPSYLSSPPVPNIFGNIWIGHLVFFCLLVLLCCWGVHCNTGYIKNFAWR